MNSIPIELGKRERFSRTVKILEKEFGGSGPLRRLDNFIKFKDQVNDKSSENAKPKNKLSFDVDNQFSSYKFLSRFKSVLM